MGKKVISFSLYGRHPQYTLGAIANARHARIAYPGWICRFYVADDVPESVISRLKDYGAEVINMGEHSSYEGTFWRFLAMIDPEVDIALSRDADSRFTKCELLMVNEWLASDKKFHVMRWGLYSPPIMAGLWGVRGGLPNLKEPLESSLRLAVITGRGGDQEFLKNNLYPEMTGNAFVHELDSQVKRECFVGETIHPFPPIAEDERGKFLSVGILPVGMRMPTRRTFIVLSIYKRTPFSEYFLVQLLNGLERLQPFSYFNIRFNIRFYVADNIRSELVKRLRHFGKVILKSAKTTYEDDPQYWKLSILSEKNLGAALMVDFWQFFLLVRGSRKLRFYEPLPIDRARPSTGIKSLFGIIYPLSFSGPAAPVADIDNLIAQRNPDESYQKFVLSVIYPRTSTTRFRSVLMRKIDSTGFVKTWFRILSPLWLYDVASWVKKYQR